MAEKEKSSFNSKIGFILAAAGSAVGLGNIWRFPYLAARYGGGIFLIVYILLAVTFGFSLMTTEISIGRKTRKSVIGAYSEINKNWSFLGIIAAIVPTIIFPYYCVIGGWVLKYLVTFSIGKGTVAADGGSFFSSFIGHAGQPTIYFLIFLLGTAAIVMLGVEKGIEKFSKILMPVLLIIIVGIAIYTLTLKGAVEGFLYYIKPDFSAFSFKTIIAAMGQLFYSMSLAMGIMVTYGSYMRKEDDIKNSVRQISVFDTAVAIIAGMIIVPAVFVFSGGDRAALNAGPSLMFITLPQVFETMPGGQFVGAIFFVLVVLAALTSAISLMEAIVSIICEKFHLARIPSCLITLGLGIVLGLLSVFGYSIWDKVLVFGMQFLDFFDFISNNVIMPLVALLTCVLISVVVGVKYVEDEVMLSAKTFRAKWLYRVMVCNVCPACMVLIFISSVFGL